MDQQNCLVRSNPDAKIYVFKWTNKHVSLLCIGYVRQYLTVGVKDLSYLIFIYFKTMVIDYHIIEPKYSRLSYLSDKSVICNFKILNKDNKKNDHDFSTLIFTPYISTLLNTKQINKLNCLFCGIKITLRKAECQIVSPSEYHFKMWFNLYSKKV